MEPGDITTEVPDPKSQGYSTTTTCSNKNHEIVLCSISDAFNQVVQQLARAKP